MQFRSHGVSGQFATVGAARVPHEVTQRKPDVNTTRADGETVYTVESRRPYSIRSTVPPRSYSVVQQVWSASRVRLVCLL
jgi:hypothetical protein